jgi:hypothetical protein
MESEGITMPKWAQEVPANKIDNANIKDRDLIILIINFSFAKKNHQDKASS